MPTQKLTLQQQQQLLHAACLAVLNSPDTVYPIRFDPFEHFVSKGGHESNRVPSLIDNSRDCSTLGVEDVIGSLVDPEKAGCCYCNSLEGEDAGSHNSEANGHCYCSTLGEKDDAGAIESNTRCYCSSIEGKDAGGIARGDDVIVEGDNTHLPGDAGLGDDHGANDINLVNGDLLGSVGTNLIVHNAEISGDINPAFLEHKLLSPPIEKMDYDTVPVSYPYVKLEKECGDSNTPFSQSSIPVLRHQLLLADVDKAYTKVQDSVRRSRLRVRRFTRSRPGVPRCTRLRPRRFSNDSSFRFSSSLVEYIEVDSFDELEEMAGFCEPMDIDSSEEMSAGDDQQLAVGNFGYFSFGYVPNLKEGSFEPVVTGAGSPVCSIPFLTSSSDVFLPPSNGIFLKESVPSDGVPVTGTKFETSVSTKRECTPVPEPLVQENVAETTKEKKASSLATATIYSPRPLVKVSSACLKSRPAATCKPRAATGSSATTTTFTTARTLVEDPFDSKPFTPIMKPERKASTAAIAGPANTATTSSATTVTTEESYSNSAIFNALFGDVKEEEEAIDIKKHAQWESRWQKTILFQGSYFLIKKSAIYFLQFL
ncbi:hypothetical protein MFLAVUS_004696 [Mucor flavus]|uniref:Uncharacterized protein n=1 Tax=Mucor flavus TaxID=439312 RepID=A0ABP9YWM8_9FUNG